MLEKNVVIDAKNAQIVIMQLLGFFNSCFLVNKAHCCATSMVIEFVATIVLLAAT